ncbi:MAG TPA: alginate export family protein [Gemmatimonadaceae bacterium]
MSPRMSDIPRATIGAALLLAAGAAGAQTAPPTPPASPVVSFFGEVRARSEYDRPGGVIPADAFTYLRSRFGARADVGQGATIVLQLQDSRILGAEGNVGATAPDVFDLHQGYLQLGGIQGGYALDARAGRQEIALGNERLVGAVAWSNTGRSFDGLRLGVRPASSPAWDATFFAATVEERGRHAGATATAPRTPDHVAVGLYATRGRTDGASASRLLADATVLYDGGARYRSYLDANRTTLDLRLRAPALGPMRAELEGAYQIGNQDVVAATDTTSQTVGAWLLGARVGSRAAYGAQQRPSLTLGADLLSGDRTPRDGRYGAFATMFGTNHPFYGLMDVLGDPSAQTKERGLVDLLVQGSTPLSPSVLVKGELHHFAAAVGDDRALGSEADLILPVRVSSAASVELGGALFRAEKGAAPLGLGEAGKIRGWAYLQMRVGF